MFIVDPRKEENDNENKHNVTSLKILIWDSNIKHNNRTSAFEDM